MFSLFGLFKRQKKSSPTSADKEAAADILSGKDHYGRGICFERAVEEWLKNRGYEAICRNYRVRGGEIDIIMKKDDILAFIEVKARYDSEAHLQKYGRPSAAVDAKKRQSIIYAAKDYIRTHPYIGRPRMDVVEVYYRICGDFIALRFNHITSAFTARR